MPPKLYGWQHLTYLAIFLVIFVTTIILTHYFIKTEKQKKILIKSVAAVLLVFIILNRISIAIRFNDPAMFIPNSYCGLTSLVISLVVLFGKPNLKSYHFLFYMGFVGGIATMFYPDFLGQDPSFMYLPTISGLLHHSVLLLLTVLMLQTKWFTPSLSGWKWFPIGLSIYTLYGLFLMDIFGWGSAMEINSTLVSGTPLTWWFILLVGSALLYAFLWLLEFFRKRKAIKQPKQTDQIQ